MEGEERRESEEVGYVWKQTHRTRTGGSDVGGRTSQKAASPPPQPPWVWLESMGRRCCYCWGWEDWSIRGWREVGSETQQGEILDISR